VFGKDVMGTLSFQQHAPFLILTKTFVIDRELSNSIGLN